MNKKEIILFNNIRNHLAELHDKWEKDELKDGHCKSSEGSIELVASYPNWFDSESNKEKYLSAKPKIGISVYSYLFGPNRTHTYYSLEDAWNNIKEWDYQPEL